MFQVDISNEKFTALAARIASRKGISSDDSIDLLKRQVDQTLELMRTAAVDMTEAEAENRALNAAEDLIFPAAATSGKSGDSGGKRAKIICATLVYMQQQRSEGRDRVFAGHVARFLYVTAVRRTRLDRPDSRSIGDALGKEGLRLKKNDDDSYPIPSVPQHFIQDERIGIKLPAPEESTLEALCKKYGVAFAQHV